MLNLIVTGREAGELTVAAFRSEGRSLFGVFVPFYCR